MVGNKNCPFCGGAVENDATICNQCGGPLKKAPEPAAGNPLKMTHCPQCKAPVSPGDILCMACGTNLLTGQKVVSPEKQAEEKADRGILIAVAKWVSAALIALVLAGLVVFAVLYWLRDPMGEAWNQAKAGNLELATETLQSYIQKNPERTEAQFLLAKVYWHGQRYDKAADMFATVAKKGESNARDALLLSLLASEELAGNAPEQREKQLALLNSLVDSQFAGDGELKLLLALLEGKQGDFGRQRRAVDEALLYGAEAADILPVLSYALDNDLAALERYVEKRQTDGGELNPEAQAAAGIMRLSAGQVESAVTTLSALPSISPHVDGWVKLQLGALYMRQGEYGKALPLLADAKHQQPENERAVFLHALCLQENKLTEEALSAFDQIVNGRKVFAGQAALQQAQILASQNNLDRAAAMAREAAELGLNTARQATVQGQIFALQGDALQAEQAYRRALSMSSEYAPAYLELGLLLISRNATQEGLTQLDQYLELAQTDPVALHANEIELLVAQIRQSQE